MVLLSVLVRLGFGSRWAIVVCCWLLLGWCWFFVVWYFFSYFLFETGGLLFVLISCLFSLSFVV